MTQLDRHVARAQRRMWFNRWLAGLGWMLLIAIGLWTAGLVTMRILGAAWPLLNLTYLALGAAFLSSLAWLTITRESRELAAVTVDEAAGLRERVSSSLYCAPSPDPFAQAVIQDAQRAIAGISTNRLIPIRWSRSLTYSAFGVSVAGMFFWLFPNCDVLGKAQAAKLELQRREERQRVLSQIQRPVEAVKEIVDKHTDLKNSPEFAKLDDLLKQEKMEVAPDARRREAVKKIDKLSDALREKAESEKYSGMDDMKRMLGALGEQSDPKSQVGKLAESLSNGDYKGAQDAVKKMPEQLAKREHGGGNPRQPARRI